MKTIKLGTMAGVFCAVLLAQPNASFGQTNLNFNGISTTVEGAVRLSWNSTSNEVYEIDYADSLIDTNTGAITWIPLYTDYPSHGTNTFITDAGNYNVDPDIVPHPKHSPMRFYRVALAETSTSPVNPTVMILSPTNGQSLSDDFAVQVSASSPEILSEVKLYVDGEEQWADDTGTNFVINTCEWPGGMHTLFATAKSQSNLEGTPDGPVITYGRSVSSYVTVTFDNLINRFDFSQPFFEPDLGQTQAVTASFNANVGWTLEIQDDNSNDVRVVSGTGTSMEFDWDGTDSNNVPVPNGLYWYYLSCTTSGAGSSMTSASLSLPSTEEPQWLIAPSDGSGSVVPLQIYPLGFDTNSCTIFPGYLSDYTPHSSSELAPVMSASFAEGFSPAFSGSSQNTRGPKRSPKIRNKGVAGTFGQLFKQYSTNGFVSLPPLSGFPAPLRTRCGVDGNGPTVPVNDYRILQFATMALDFATGMKKAGWKSMFLKPDVKWNANTIKKSSLGGSQIFDTCNLGVLYTHGSFANPGQPEADGVLYTYVWLGPNNYVRLSDMQFGDSAGTNGLKWMTLFGCNILRPANITSMANNSKLPIGDNLHLLLGSATVNWADSRMGKFYAKELTSGSTIENSWYNAAIAVFAGSPYVTNTVTYRVMGQGNCFGDTIKVNQDPDINATFEIKSKDVFVHP